MKKLRVVLYWITLIPPIVDVIKGAYLGVKKGLEDITSGRTLRDEAEALRWERANRGE